MTAFETTQWIMPSLMRIFAGGDNIVEFDPTGPEDEQTAEQESDYLNYLVTQKNDWELTVREWCQDALVTKNAYCYAYMEEKLKPEKEFYEGMTGEQLALLLDDDVEIVGQQQRVDEDNQDPVMDPMSGQPVIDPFTGQPMMQPRMLYDVEIKRVKASKNLKFQVLPPERVRVAVDTPDFSLEDCNFFEYWERCTISELRKQGYDIDDDVAEDNFSETEEDRSRNEALELDLDRDSPDPAMRQVVVRTIWIRHDYDEDGIAELQRCVLVGREVLEREEANRIPVACIVPFINTHRHMGNSVVDLVFDIQRIKTALLRSGLDSLNLANNPRHYLNTNNAGPTTIDDLLVARPGAVVRGEGAYMETLGILQTENTFPFAQQGLDHMDRVVEARVGVNRMFQGIDTSAMSGNNAHNAIGQLSTMAAQRVEDIARLFGCGFKRLFSIAHELIIKSGHSQEAIKLRGEWVNIDPTQWRTGRDMRVVAPFAAGNKDALLQRLMIIKQIHAEALAGGLPIVTPDDSYELGLEIAKAADLSGTKFFTDPKMIPPKQPPPDYTMMALEVENKKADNQAQGDQLDAEMDRYKADLAAELDKYRADLNAELQLALANIKAGNSVDLESVKARLRDAPIEMGNEAIKGTGNAVAEMSAALSDALSGLHAVVQQIQANATAPIEIVRKDGKITGKRVNGQFIPLKDVK